MKAFSISIPKPCHEDWNKMTPDAKGAFCASCQKSVYDFSTKTDEEIVAVFEKEEKGKVCGRFAPAQLSRPVISFGNPTTTSRLAIFAYALLMVFGAALFNGTTAYGQEMIKGEMKMMGKPSIERLTIKEDVEITDTVKSTITNNPVNTVKKPITCGLRLREVKDVDLTSLGQAVIIDEPVRIFGDTLIAIETITGEEEETQEYIKMGEVEYVQPMGMMVMEPMDTLAMAEPIEPIELIEPVETIQMMVAGGVSYVEIFENSQEEYPVDHSEEELTTIITPIETIVVEEVIPVEEEVVPVEEETNNKTGLVAETIIIPPADLQVTVSPNPSRGEITLSYTLASEMPVRIDLYDNSGKMIRTLTKQGNQYAGKYNSMFNIADLQNGTYTAVMITADRKVSAKVILTK